MEKDKNGAPRRGEKREAKTRPVRGDTGNTAQGAKQRNKKRSWKPLFLAAFRNSANVRAACEAANISRKTAYQHRERDPKFAAQWDEAEQDAVDVLEARAWQRSQVSDTILMFLMRAHRPQKYTERVKQEQVGAVETVLRVVYDDPNENRIAGAPAPTSPAPE